MQGDHKIHWLIFCPLGEFLSMAFKNTSESGSATPKQFWFVLAYYTELFILKFSPPWSSDIENAVLYAEGGMSIAEVGQWNFKLFAYKT